MENVMSISGMYRVAEVELVYKTKVKASERPKVSGSKEVYQLLAACWDESKIEFVEQFKILLLNRGNKVLGVYEISTGGMAGTIADPKVIFSAALKACASSIILSHNHPSGNLKPSDADIQLTRKIINGGNLLDIAVLDHVIISAEGYYSFADEGLI
ncbi:JAB domain-containing protein [Rubrolithibacter danxiaensis]|uniref:JAB domain-containing protein n=1 Tax=Rubrolithibacter danxiaensis TaxID=3390805 RepID=UPI003BF8DD04